MRSSGFTSRAFGPGLRYATPYPLPARRLPSRPVGLAFGRCLIPGGARAGGTVAGTAPRAVFDAFLPCSVQRSKKHPQSRVNSASLAAKLPLTSEPLFLLSRVSKSCPEGGRDGNEFLRVEPVGDDGGADCS